MTPAAISTFWAAALPLLLLAAFQGRSRWRERFGAPIVYGVAALCLIVAAKSLLVIAADVYWRWPRPLEWDFLAFWAYAQAGASGQDFYRVETFAHLPFPRPPSEDFVKEVLQVGFLYPPPTMLLLLPLGWLNMPQGYLFWYGIQFLALPVAVWMLWHLFLRPWGAAGLALTAAQVALFPPLQYTFQCSQTNVLTLCAFLAYWKYRDSFRGGSALAMGLVLKPYFAALLLFPAVRRHFRAGAGFLGVTLALGLITALVFGGGIFRSYTVEKPAARLPAEVFKEGVNQSLSSFFLRAGAEPIGPSPVFTVPNLMVCGTMGLLTLWAVFRSPKEDSDGALCLTLMFALSAYPGALVHYGLMALPVLFLLWARRARLPGGAWTAAFVFACVYGMAGTGFTLGGHVLLWVVWLWQCPGMPWSRRDRERVSAGIP